ncbi:hypothetical protein FOQG_15738 [Fusarium oxysporum f. sp. raphani 54005]|uniref:Uncharacterized protein n=2 Tax=Fusarium oxysporum f. sp. raphani TaxID=96318 RepID=X0BLF7_FUSOX|nr:hypothetical protein FOQG_15738 [Fusarium oxysporum f. sp. raphani 54005]KAG7408899.1 hypothetical protein Forpi1262_v017939 [Fusarium oxysporum f. sp. raphani]
MRVTTEIDTAGQVKQPLPHAPHDIQVTPEVKLRIVISNKENDIEGVDRQLLESTSHYGIHRVNAVNPQNHFKGFRGHGSKGYAKYLRKVSLEDCDEHESDFLDCLLKKLDGYALIFAARGVGRLGYTFPSNVCLDNVSDFPYALICIHRVNATQGAARCLKLTSKLKSCDPWSQREFGTLLRDHRGFGRKWHLEAVPSDYSFSTFVRQLQSSPKTRTCAADWLQCKPGGAAIRFIIKCYKALECRASEDEIKMKNPKRLLFNIYIMCNEERAAPGRYAQPKTPPSFECGGRIEETHHLERSDTGTPIKEKEDRTADDSTLYKCERIRAATCQNLTSIAMACWAKVKDLPRYDIAQHTTALRVCHLLFRAKEYKASHDKTLPEPCIKCISETFMRKQLEGGLKWAISETESLLSLSLSPQLEIYDRMRSCEKELNIQPFHIGGKPLFTSLGQIIAALQVMPAFNLEKKDYGVVREKPVAQAIYAVACLLESNYSPPNGLRQDDLLEVFDQFIRWLDHQSTS